VKTVVEYDGARELDDFVAFISKHTGKAAATKAEGDDDLDLSSKEEL